MSEEPSDPDEAVTYWRDRWCAVSNGLTDTLIMHDRIFEAVHDLLWKATQYGETKDGDTFAYIIPKGAVHRLVGAMQGAGKSAALRNPTVSVNPEGGEG